MKKNILLLLCFTIFSLVAGFSQNAPQGFNYQSVVRNAAGSAHTNQTVTMLTTLPDGGYEATLSNGVAHQAKAVLISAGSVRRHLEVSPGLENCGDNSHTNERTLPKRTSAVEPTTVRSGHR